jgi:amino acid adenylation domain-containing protein
MNPTPTQPANPTNIEDIYELSPMQQGLLFHTLSAPNVGMYCDQNCITLSGTLDRSAFAAAWQQVIQRHPILRTSFHWEGLEKPLQVVHSTVALPIHYHDWRHLSPDEQQTRLTAFLEVDRKQDFELTQAPLMRLALIQTSDTVYQFIFSKHHLLLDGWSRVLVLKEVVELHQSLSQGQPLFLKPSRPYRDYIAWFRQQDLTQAEAFWRHTLQGFTSPTPIGIGHGMHPTFSPQGDYVEQQRQLSEETTTALNAFARSHQLTLNTLVQGAWALLLSRYSSETDIVFGVTSSGRPADLEGVESMVGLFVNTLPMRVQVPLNAELIPWLKQFQAQQVALRQYEYSPLSQVQEWSDVPRGRPLFESIVILENAPVDPSLRRSDHSSDHSLVVQVSGLGRTNYPLTVLAGPGTALSLMVWYDSDRFEHSSIARLLGHWETLLQGMVEHPTSRLVDLPLLTPEEQQQFAQWNQTFTPFPLDACLHHLIEAQVDRTPAAIAVRYEGQSLSYQQLNQQSNQLAHHLRQRGVTPDTPIGVCLPRSLELLVTLLAILKAGGAFLPLDFDYPPARLSLMLEDAQPPVILTTSSLQSSLPDSAAQLVCLDSEWETIVQQSTDNPNTPVTAHHLAYVIYTSGSTGKPKGVQIIHTAVVNFLLSMCREPGISADDVLLAVTTLSFDIAVLELFAPLIVGAQVVIASRDVTIDGHRLAAQLNQSHATLLQATPATWRMLLDAGWEGRDGLTMLCGGEALPRELANALLSKGAALWNMYGPTETTIWSAVSQVQPSEDSVYLGNPIANTQFYVLDDQQNLVPVGVPGELYIGGSGLARGYFNRPELTQERFVPNPFVDEPDARMYRTGDRVRRLADGNLEFLGRVDYQVKIRGFRIELGEIESVLRKHKAVSQCVVIDREDTPGDQRLVAYLVCSQIDQPTAAEFRRFLQQELPEYMIPAAFIVLESLPLTPNGKVERRALPQPDSTRPTLDVAFTPPQTAIEQTVATIWRSVLKLETIGIHDSFFELGGNSLLLMQVYSKLREKFHTSLSLLDLFRYPTVSSVAEFLNQDLHLENKDLVTANEMDHQAADSAERMNNRKARLKQRLQQSQNTRMPRR